MKKLEKASDWKGIWTALITPFDAQGQVDKSSLEKLIQRQIKEGVTGLVIAGSTGEGSLLSDESYEALIRTAVEISAGKIPIVAGLGIGGTKDSLARAALAKKAGAHGLLASTPAYIKAPARGLVAHFKKLCSLELPLCLYDIPGRSGSGLPDEVVDELLASDVAKWIHALKDATGNPERIKNKNQWKDKIALLSGDDESFPGFIQVGGHGIISVASHFTLKDYFAVLKNEKGALEHYEKITPFLKALFWESNPIPVKSLAHKLGWIADSTFQEPLCPMKPELLQDLQELYRKSFV